MNKILISAIIASSMTCTAFATVDKHVTSKGYVDTQVATKQPKITTTGTNKAVTYPTQAGGQPTVRVINTDLGSSTEDTNLAETGAINRKLNDKQGKFGGAQNTVMTYGNGQGATPGSKPVYAAGNYNANALVEAQHVNSAVATGFNSHLTCHTYEGANNTGDCLLWDVNPLSTSTHYVP